MNNPRRIDHERPVRRFTAHRAALTVLGTFVGGLLTAVLTILLSATPASASATVTCASNTVTITDSTPGDTTTVLIQTSNLKINGALIDTFGGGCGTSNLSSFNTIDATGVSGTVDFETDNSNGSGNAYTLDGGSGTNNLQLDNNAGFASDSSVLTLTGSGGGTYTHSSLTTTTFSSINGTVSDNSDGALSSTATLSAATGTLLVASTVVTYAGDTLQGFTSYTATGDVATIFETDNSNSSTYTFTGSTTSGATNTLKFDATSGLTTPVLTLTGSGAGSYTETGGPTTITSFTNINTVDNNGDSVTTVHLTNGATFTIGTTVTYGTTTLQSYSTFVAGSGTSTATLSAATGTLLVASTVVTYAGDTLQGFTSYTATGDVATIFETDNSNSSTYTFTGSTTSGATNTLKFDATSGLTTPVLTLTGSGAGSYTETGGPTTITSFTNINTVDNNGDSVTTVHLTNGATFTIGTTVTYGTTTLQSYSTFVAGSGTSTATLSAATGTLLVASTVVTYAGDTLQGFTSYTASGDVATIFETDNSNSSTYTFTGSTTSGATNTLKFDATSGLTTPVLTLTGSGAGSYTETGGPTTITSFTNINTVDNNGDSVTTVHLGASSTLLVASTVVTYDSITLQGYATFVATGDVATIFETDNSNSSTYTFTGSTTSGATNTLKFDATSGLTTPVLTLTGSGAGSYTETGGPTTITSFTNINTVDNNGDSVTTVHLTNGATFTIGTTVTYGTTTLQSYSTFVAGSGTSTATLSAATGTLLVASTVVTYAGDTLQGFTSYTATGDVATIFETDNSNSSTYTFTGSTTSGATNTLKFDATSGLTTPVLTLTGSGAGSYTETGGPTTITSFTNINTVDNNGDSVTTVHLTNGATFTIGTTVTYGTTTLQSYSTFVAGSGTSTATLSAATGTLLVASTVVTYAGDTLQGFTSYTASGDVATIFETDNSNSSTYTFTGSTTSGATNTLKFDATSGLTTPVLTLTGSGAGSYTETGGPTTITSFTNINTVDNNGDSVTTVHLGASSTLLVASTVVTYDSITLQGYATFVATGDVATIFETDNSNSSTYTFTGSTTSGATNTLKFDATSGLTTPVLTLTGSGAGSYTETGGPTTITSFTNINTVDNNGDSVTTVHLGASSTLLVASTVVTYDSITLQGYATFVATGDVATIFETDNSNSSTYTFTGSTTSGATNTLKFDATSGLTTPVLTLTGSGAGSYTETGGPTTITSFTNINTVDNNGDSVTTVHLGASSTLLVASTVVTYDSITLQGYATFVATGDVATIFETDNSNSSTYTFTGSTTSGATNTLKFDATSGLTTPVLTLTGSGAGSYTETGGPTTITSFTNINTVDNNGDSVTTVHLGASSTLLVASTVVTYDSITLQGYATFVATGDVATIFETDNSNSSTYTFTGSTTSGATNTLKFDATSGLTTPVLTLTGSGAGSYTETGGPTTITSFTNINTVDNNGDSVTTVHLGASSTLLVASTVVTYDSITLQGYATFVATGDVATIFETDNSNSSTYTFTGSTTSGATNTLKFDATSGLTTPVLTLTGSGAGSYTETGGPTTITSFTNINTVDNNGDSVTTVHLGASSTLLVASTVVTYDSITLQGYATFVATGDVATIFETDNSNSSTYTFTGSTTSGATNTLKFDATSGLTTPVLTLTGSGAGSYTETGGPTTITSFTNINTVDNNGDSVTTVHLGASSTLLVASTVVTYDSITLQGYATFVATGDVATIFETDNSNSSTYTFTGSTTSGATNTLKFDATSGLTTPVLTLTGSGAGSYTETGGPTTITSFTNINTVDNNGDSVTTVHLTNGATFTIGTTVTYGTTTLQSYSTFVAGSGTSTATLSAATGTLLVASTVVTYAGDTLQGFTSYTATGDVATIFETDNSNSSTYTFTGSTTSGATNTLKFDATSGLTTPVLTLTGSGAGSYTETGGPTTITSFTNINTVDNNGDSVTTVHLTNGATFTIGTTVTYGTTTLQSYSTFVAGSGTSTATLSAATGTLLVASTVVTYAGDTLQGFTSYTASGDVATIFETDNSNSSTYTFTGSTTSGATNTLKFDATSGLTTPVLTLTGSGAGSYTETGGPTTITSFTNINTVDNNGDSVTTVHLGASSTLLVASTVVTYDSITLQGYATFVANGGGTTVFSTDNSNGTGTPYTFTGSSGTNSIVFTADSTNGSAALAITANNGGTYYNSAISSPVTTFTGMTTITDSADSAIAATVHLRNGGTLSVSGGTVTYAGATLQGYATFVANGGGTTVFSTDNSNGTGTPYTFTGSSGTNSIVFTADSTNGSAALAITANNGGTYYNSAISSPVTTFTGMTTITDSADSAIAATVHLRNGGTLSVSGGTVTYAGATLQGYATFVADGGGTTVFSTDNSNGTGTPYTFTGSSGTNSIVFTADSTNGSAALAITANNGGTYYNSAITSPVTTFTGMTTITGSADSAIGGVVHADAGVAPSLSAGGINYASAVLDGFTSYIDDAGSGTIDFVTGAGLAGLLSSSGVVSVDYPTAVTFVGFTDLVGGGTIGNDTNSLTFASGVGSVTLSTSTSSVSIGGGINFAGFTKVTDEGSGDSLILAPGFSASFSVGVGGVLVYSPTETFAGFSALVGESSVVLDVPVSDTAITLGAAGDGSGTLTVPGGPTLSFSGFTMVTGPTDNSGALTVPAASLSVTINSDASVSVGTSSPLTFTGFTSLTGASSDQLKLPNDPVSFNSDGSEGITVSSAVFTFTGFPAVALVGTGGPLTLGGTSTAPLTINSDGSASFTLNGTTTNISGFGTIISNGASVTADLPNASGITVEFGAGGVNGAAQIFVGGVLELTLNNYTTLVAAANTTFAANATAPTGYTFVGTGTTSTLDLSAIPSNGPTVYVCLNNGTQNFSGTSCATTGAINKFTGIAVFVAGGPNDTVVLPTPDAGKLTTATVSGSSVAISSTVGGAQQSEEAENFFTLLASSTSTTITADATPGYDFEGAGSGTTLSFADDGSAGATFCLAAGVVNLTGTSCTGATSYDDFSNLSNIVGTPNGDLFVIGTGNWVLSGGGGSDTANFTNAPTSSGLIINLSSETIDGTAAGSVGGLTSGNSVSLSGIGSVIGSSAGGDTFIAGALPGMLTGLGGNNTFVLTTDGDDVINGGSGSNTIDFSHLSGAVNFDLGSASLQDAGAAGLLLVVPGTVQDVIGSPGGSTIVGAGGSGTIYGEATSGNTDWLSAGAGNYVLDASAVTGTAYLFAGSGTDTLKGGQATTYFAPGPGMLTIDPNSASGAVSWLDFADAPTAVDVNLTSSSLSVTNPITGVTTSVAAGVSGGWAPAGTAVDYGNVDNVVGTAFSDIIVANSASDMIQSPGSALIVPGSGSDTITCTAGSSCTVDYASTPYDTDAQDSTYLDGVNVNLATGVATKYGYSSDPTDTLSGITTVISTQAGDDTLVAGAAGQTLVALSGIDILRASAAGLDTLDGGNNTTTFEADTSDGAGGHNTLIGGLGENIFLAQLYTSSSPPKVVSADDTIIAGGLYDLIQGDPSDQITGPNGAVLTSTDASEQLLVGFDAAGNPLYSYPLASTE